MTQLLPMQTEALNLRNPLRRHWLQVAACAALALAWTPAVHASAYDDFFIAIKRDDERAMQRLLSRGLDPNLISLDGLHGLYLAFAQESYKTADVLLRAPKIDVNRVSPSGETALMMAVLKGQQVFAERLIKMGADVNKPGWTPLHYAATGGHAPLVQLLLAAHAYIDAASPNGSTPLMMAAMYGSMEAVQLLLQEGADPSLRNEQKLSAEDFATKASRKDVAERIARAVRLKNPKGTW
jgi:uncharacterized protein